MNCVRMFRRAFAAFGLLALCLLPAAAVHAGPPSNADAAAQMAGEAGVDPSRIEITSIVLVGTHQEGDQIVEEYQINYRVLPDVKAINDAVNNIPDLLFGSKDKGAPADGAAAPVTPPAQTPVPLPNSGAAAPPAADRTPLEVAILKAMNEQNPRPMHPKVREARARAREALLADPACQTALAGLKEQDRRWLDEDPSGYRLRLAYCPDRKEIWIRRARALLDAENHCNIHGPLETEYARDNLNDYIWRETFVDADGIPWTYLPVSRLTDANFVSSYPSTMNFIVDCQDLSAVDYYQFQANVDGRIAAGKQCVRYVGGLADAYKDH